MENECYFVCSRGILKSCDFHSLNPKSSSKNDYSYLINMISSNNMKDGMSIYVCSTILKYFVNNVLPKIRNTFTLVSGDSYFCVPMEVLSEIETLRILSSPYLLKWFVQNTRIQNSDKIIQLPLGLDYHTIYNDPNCRWRLQYENRMPIDQEIILKNIAKKSRPFYERIPKIHINFSTGNDRFNQRKQSLKIIPIHLTVLKLGFMPRTITWQDMINYAFVLSPFGNGMDCHRTWEALCLGCIPIVCAPNFKKLFEDLPVLNVNHWNEINEELLINTLDKFQKINFNYEKLTLEYWINKINNT
jgi:hypothetical protein